MDKQTAVDLLDNLLGMVEDNHGSDYDKAIHMGIDALKTQDMSGNMSGTHNSLDCISRQAAKDALAKFVPYAICDESTESYTNGLTDAYNLICQLPSVQPEIIRCKDCKYWMRAYLSISGKHGCNVMRDYTAPDDYCFKAERKA